LPRSPPHMPLAQAPLLHASVGHKLDQTRLFPFFLRFKSR
jgi:hypothetical protein